MKPGQGLPPSRAENSSTRKADPSSNYAVIHSQETRSAVQSATVHQCPYCELKFLYLNEVKDHVQSDHRDHADVVAAMDAHEIPNN